ncbi:MAG: PKD domain-containing protein [Chloroflexota bacterium]
MLQLSMVLKKVGTVLATMLCALFFFVSSLLAMPPQGDMNVTPHVNEIIIEDLQNTGCDPSRYILFNPNDQDATVVQSFYPEGEDPVDGFIVATVSNSISANGQITVDLDLEGSLPNGYQGFGVITSNEPLTNVVLPDELIADFSFIFSNQFAPVQVDFVNDACGDFDEVLWDFGDGFTSAVITPSHTYTTPGIYTASLTISNSIDSDIGSKQLEVMSGAFLPSIFR